jgi:hypothetical protein
MDKIRLLRTTLKAPKIVVGETNLNNYLINFHYLKLIII